MGFEQAIARAAVCAALALSTATAIAAPREPLVLTPLPDPDPGFIPPPQEPKQNGAKSPDNAEDPTLEGAMQDFGRALGQAALVEQQQVDARCKAGLPPDATPEQRFAWAASCRYSRH